MAVTKDQVLASLAKVSSPDGEALTATGALSDVVVSDGKVFFSISVDAVQVPRWEPVRSRACQFIEADLSDLTSVTAAVAGADASTTWALTVSGGIAASGIPRVLQVEWLSVRAR